MPQISRTEIKILQSIVDLMVSYPCLYKIHILSCLEREELITGVKKLESEGLIKVLRNLKGEGFTDKIYDSMYAIGITDKGHLTLIKSRRPDNAHA